MNVVKIVVVNLFSFGSPAATAVNRRDDLIRALHSLAGDVYAVSEVWAMNREEALGRLYYLAGELGMSCQHDGKPALSHSAAHGQVAVLWRPDLPVAGVVDHRTDPYRFVVVEFDLGLDHPFAVGSYHATPFERDQRPDAARRIQGIMTRDHRGHGILCGDFNDTGAAEIDGTYYDPDWSATRPWHPDFVHVCERYTDAGGVLRHKADRRAAHVLEWGGLHDAAAHLRVPWARTEGHWPGDETYGDRRLIRAHVKTNTLAALRNITVTDTPLTRAASDHLPVTVELDPSAVAG